MPDEVDHEVLSTRHVLKLTSEMVDVVERIAQTRTDRYANAQLIFVNFMEAGLKAFKTGGATSNQLQTMEGFILKARRLLQ